MSSKLRWGVLGTGKMARGMIGAMNQSRNGLVHAVASRDAARARAVADELKVPHAYGGYEKLIADPQVDAVYIALPTAMHAEWAMRCAAAGKPVLCEKPLAADTAEARQMAEAFARRKLTFGEALMYRFHPMTQRVKAMVDKGDVGRVLMIRTSFPAPVKDAEDFRFRPESGGGAMLDLGCYCVDFMRLIAGHEPEQIRALAAFGKHTGVDESLVGILSFPGGVLGYFGCCFRAQYDCSYDVVGTDGRILVDGGGMVAWPAEFAIRWWHGDDYQEFKIPPANHYTLLAEDFADAVMEKRPPKHSVEESIRNMQVIDRILGEARE